MLVISSDTFPVYKHHREVWRTYMKSHPNVDCYFLQSSPLVFVPTLTDDTLFLRGTERYGSILAKTLAGLEYFLRRPYTHVVRTNLSSVWDFKALVSYLQTLPSSRVYGGMLCDGDGTMYPYASGAGILFTRDTAEALLAHRRLALSVGIIDDVDIGHTMRTLQIPLTAAPRMDFISLAHYEKTHDTIPPGTFHYRVKHQDYRGDRMEEPEMMRRLLRDHILVP
jgi:hypothetical protein